MTSRRIFLLLTVAALLGGLALWRDAKPATIASIARAPAAHAVTLTARVVEKNVDAAPPRAIAPAEKITRAEAAAFVRALYRKEQLTRELDLEQQRYGAHYWQAEHSLRAIVSLQQAKAALLQQLAVEANEVLDKLFPDQAGEPLAFAAIFDADRPGPQVASLTVAQRERFEAEILARGADRDASPERWLEVAQAILPANAWETYRDWNEPAAAALRARLVGFDATEAEFGAILRATRAQGDARADVAAAELETTLGAARFAEWQATQAPALRGALQDLRRLDLPLENAAWLVATRASATAAIQRTWQDATLADAVKVRQVAQLERVYGRIIATKLSLSAASLDELGLEP